MLLTSSSEEECHIDLQLIAELIVPFDAIGHLAAGTYSAQATASVGPAPLMSSF